jgi:hypothetical protein
MGILSIFKKKKKRGNNDLILTSASHVESNNLSHGHDPIKFTVHKASGGYVVETSYFDEKTDRQYYNLHIITDEEDFNQELGKAVFMDMLKRR